MSDFSPDVPTLRWVAQQAVAASQQVFSQHRVVAGGQDRACVLAVARALYNFSKDLDAHADKLEPKVEVVSG